jgi:hypothetical protein
VVDVGQWQGAFGEFTTFWKYVFAFGYWIEKKTNSLL